MSPIASGRRRQRVLLEVPAPPVADGNGGYTEAYAPLVPPDAYAAIDTAPGTTEQRVADTAIGSATYRVTIPYRRDITNKVRLTFTDAAGRARLLWVRGVENPAEANIELHLWCEEKIA